MRTHNTFFEKDRQAEITSFLSSDYFYYTPKIKRIDVINITPILIFILDYSDFARVGSEYTWLIAQ